MFGLPKTGADHLHTSVNSEPMSEKFETAGQSMLVEHKMKFISDLANRAAVLISGRSR
jgi:ABC-type branched-subunit amino acid transport system ATPase component